ncbi:hypothetical protein [Mesorhizobium sp. CAU 1741]|uniref:hypothetical protein n=1 Tax=Mesorhizobium sp. CAU 1741 TaxID=3140366 RepID=UPI00325B41FE
MIVDYSPADGLRLVEPDDFKGFKLRLRETTRKRPEIENVFYVDDDNVLVAVDAVPALPGAPPTAEWLADYRKMIDYAAGKGWIDADSNAIRAHVERSP